MRMLIWYLVGLVVRWTTPDPCKGFLAELEKNDVLDFGIGPQLPEIEAQRFPAKASDRSARSS